MRAPCPHAASETSMLSRAVAAGLVCLALPGLAAADCAPGGMAGDWLLTSDLDIACPIAVDAGGAFTSERCRGTGAAYAGRLAADDHCAVELVLARSEGGRVDTLRGVGTMAIDLSRIDGYYIEPGVGAVGFSAVRD